VDINIEKTSLMRYLQKQNPVYYGKTLELRSAIAGWLQYVPQTFPHYPRHTIEHSETIIAQLSNLLFKEDDPDKYVIKISATEAYILIAAAYLHDAGMVVSDKEKIDILQSAEWKEWTTNSSGGAKRFIAIEQFREGSKPTEKDLRNFLADVQLRFLIAEFIRKSHHSRVGQILAQHQSTLARFAFDSNQLLLTISDICLSHGLKHHELRDRERFPLRRDINGEKVNVRFLSILLRMGDLLDMSSDRACSLLLNAACPLPVESFAHWTQYNCITHFMVAPDKIELRAECNNQKEHQVIQDWCQWLVDEVKEAAILMARAERHREWIPPEVTLGDNNSTIQIKPAKGATYTPSRWILQLDTDAVFERFIKDAYDYPLVFVRELIQNALDANRCQIYSDAASDGLDAPKYPTQFPEDIRQRYKVKITLKGELFKNELSGEDEQCQVLTVEDCGIGMDHDIIERYFLQVGRSYYDTDEFRRTFSFVPTSRFGVGFLSIFAVSEQVVVETYKPSSPNNDGPIRLTLTGPKNYLLTDKGTRRETGTRIGVRLKQPIEQGELTKKVNHWCKRVEFPILVDDLGTQSTILSERPEDFVCEIPDVTQQGAKFAIKAFPVNRPGIEGELYVLAHVTDQGESWTKSNWAKHDYPNSCPQAAPPLIPGSLECLHGITIRKLPRHRFASLISRIDYRDLKYDPTLSRQTFRQLRSEEEMPSEIAKRWAEILTEHIKNTKLVEGSEGWKYKQELWKQYPIPSFWESVSGTLCVSEGGVSRLISITELKTFPSFTTVVPSEVTSQAYSYFLRDPKSFDMLPTMDVTTPAFTYGNVGRLNGICRQCIFSGRVPTNIRWLSKGYIAIDWSVSDSSDSHVIFSYKVSIVSLPNCDYLRTQIHATDSTNSDHYFVNIAHPFVKKLLEIKGFFEKGSYSDYREQLNRLINLFGETINLPTDDRITTMASYIKAWQKLPGLPPELHLPEVEWSDKLFKLDPPKEK
jgi:hypothetical protein